MLQRIQYHASHAFAPIFRYTPQHKVKDCPYCSDRIRHQSNHIQLNVPLAQHENILTSSQITRISLCLAPSYTQSSHHETLPHAVTQGLELQQLHREHAQCKVSRLLMDQSDYIHPSRTNLLNELRILLTSMKIRDRLLLSVSGYNKSGALVTSDDEVFTSTDFLTLVHSIDKSLSLWVMIDLSPPTPFVHLPFRYTMDRERNRVQLQKVEAAVETGIRLHILTYTTTGKVAEEKEPIPFPPGWCIQIYMDIMKEYKCRLCVATLLEKLSDRMNPHGMAPLLLTNYLLSPKNTYFGFG